MEPQRFDELAASVAKGESSRRSVILRFGGGAFAALLATLGVGGLDAEAVSAKRRCKRRCKKKDDKDKRRRCKRRCRKKPSTPGGPGPECTGTGDCPGTDICVDNECVTRPAVPILCDDDTDCSGGLACIGDICVLECEDDDECAGSLLCLGGACVLDTECDIDDDCEDPLLGICLLGLCVDDIL